MPVGIPTPNFGWQYNTDVKANIFVDNSNPNCSNSGGSADRPLCHLLGNGTSATFKAGDVVQISGGPYRLSRKSNIRLNGTANNPIIIKGKGSKRITFEGNGSDRAEVYWSGQYAIVENIDFYKKTRHVVDTSYFVARNIAVRNPQNMLINFNPIVSIKGHDVTIHESEIYNNMRNNDLDSHGIQASQGSYNVWVIDNEIYRNNGDAFQACHNCFNAPPHHVYLGRNNLHDNRENGIDLKTIHDVVISENIIYNHKSSKTSIGDSIVVGSNGFDNSKNQGPRRVWLINNEIRDSDRGVRIEGSQDVWMIGNTFSSLKLGVRIDRKKHRDITIDANTFASISGDGLYVDGCNPRNITLKNNVFSKVGGRDIDTKSCSNGELKIENNFFSGKANVSISSKNFASTSSLNQLPSASNNREGDPMLEDSTLMPKAGSPLLKSGASLDNVYSGFWSEYNHSIAYDQAGVERNNPQDIGAYTRP